MYCILQQNVKVSVLTVLFTLDLLNLISVYETSLVRKPAFIFFQAIIFFALFFVFLEDFFFFIHELKSSYIQLSSSWFMSNHPVSQPVTIRKISQCPWWFLGKEVTFCMFFTIVGSTHFHQEYFCSLCQHYRKVKGKVIILLKDIWKNRS